MLVHELAHSVMDLGMSPRQLEAISTAYDKAKEGNLYDMESYMMANRFEYWAMGAQAWFDAISFLCTLLY